VTRGISPPKDASALARPPRSLAFSSDLTKAIVTTNAEIMPTGLPEGAFRLYLQENSGSQSSYQLLSSPFQPITTPLSNADDFEFAGASDDFTHVLFVSTVALTADALLDDSLKVYESVNGDLRLASVLPSGDPAPASLPGARRPLITALHPGSRVVTPDGSRVFFTAFGSGLYVREGGTTTRPISASERPGDDPELATAGAVFQASSEADGSTVFFTSAVQLTGDAKANDGVPDLYRWDANALPGHRLLDLTTGDPQGGGVLGVSGAATDGSRVYFVATGNLVPGTTGTGPKMYLWDAKSGVRHVADLEGNLDSLGFLADEALWTSARAKFASFPGPPIHSDARVAADGSRLLFASYAQLTSYDTAGYKQVYLYDAVSGDTRCISCNFSTAASQADAALFGLSAPPTGDSNSVRSGPTDLSRNLSYNGRRAIFETPEALVPTDSNGRRDVYIWEDGEVSLISAGDGTDDSEFVDASSDGADVFFVTRDRLATTDVDNLADLYDARVGGGIAAQNPPPPRPPCQEDSCQGSLAGRPLLMRSGSDAGGGDRPSARRASFVVGDLSAAQRRRLASGRRVTMAVRVGRAGRLRLQGRARLGRRARVVMTASATARRAGVLRLSLRLSSRARRHLVSGKLDLTLALRFTGVTQPKVMHVRLSQSGRSTARRAR
jgi:hypothetical protein